jgi:hypothetical protein
MGHTTTASRSVSQYVKRLRRIWRIDLPHTSGQFGAGSGTYVEATIPIRGAVYVIGETRLEGSPPRRRFSICRGESGGSRRRAGPKFQLGETQACQRSDPYRGAVCRHQSRPPPTRIPTVLLREPGR